MMPCGHGGHKKRAHAAPREQQRASDSRKLDLYWAAYHTSTRTQWDLDHTSSRSRLGSLPHLTLLDLHWTSTPSTGPLPDLYLTSNGPILDVHWTSSYIKQGAGSQRRGKGIETFDSHTKATSAEHWGWARAIDSPKNSTAAPPLGRRQLTA